MRRVLCFTSLVRLAFALATAASIGCATQKSWSYRAESISSSPILVNKSVSVPPFMDTRQNENQNMFGMYMIPLMPYGWMSYKTPEGAQMHMTSGLWMWRPNEDIAKAAAEEMNSSHVFKEVFFSHRASEGELVLHGTIKSTDFEGKLFSYGLSIYGPALWFIGFPSTSANNELEISLSLRDPATNAILWERSYRRADGNLSWLYVMKSDFLYPDLLKEILMEAVRDIRSEAPGFKVQ